MDDYTWQRKLRRRRDRREQEFMFLFVIVAAAIGTAFWYFGLYAKTPEHALEEIVAAATDNDREKFARYVNLDLITMHAYDDLTVDLFAHDETLPPQTRVLFEKFYVLIKPQLSAGMQETVLTKIGENRWSKPKGLDVLKGRQLGIDYEIFLERSLMKSTEFVSMGNPETNGNRATAEINVRETNTDTPFTLLVTLEKNEEGWQAIHITNYKAYLDAVAVSAVKDIDEYIAATKGIMDDANEKMRANKEKFVAMSAVPVRDMTDEQKNKLFNLLTKETIPTLKKIRQQIENSPAKGGATYLGNLRLRSLDLAAKMWDHYAVAVKNNDNAEFETAESLHKEQLDMELRIDEIKKHAAVVKNQNEIP